MKIKFLCILIFLISNYIFAQKEYNSYELEEITTYNVKKEKIGINMRSAGSDPTGPSLLFIKDKLIINDEVNSELLETSYNYNIINRMPVNNFWNDSKYNSYSNTLIDYSKYGIKITDLKGKEIIKILWKNYQIKTHKDFLYYDKYLFIITDENKLICFKVQINSSPKLIINEEEIKKIINKKYSDKIKIEDNYFFLNNKLHTRNYKRFYEYWKNKLGEIKKQANSKEITMTAEDLLGLGLIFIGKDNNGNYYWRQSQGIIIFSEKGELLDIFVHNNTNEYYKEPALNPSGDLYYIDYDEKEVRLYKITNVWDK